MQRTFTRLLTLSTVFFTVHAFSQNAPYYTHYMLNKLAFNPATAGEKDAICVSGLAHQQWLGQKDQSSRYYDVEPKDFNSGVNPGTQSFSITAPFLKNNQLGAGLTVINDKLGYNSALYLRGALAYKFFLGRKLQNGSSEQVFSVGLDAGMVQIGLDGTKYNPLQPGDPKVPTSKVSGSSFDMGAGLYYTHQRIFDGLYAGLSLGHLTRPSVDVAGFINYRTSRYIYLLAGTRHELGSIALLPSFLFRTGGGTNAQVDIGARLEFNQKLVAGLNVRTQDAVSLLLGYYIRPNFYAGYSYDFTLLSRINQYTRSGTHELFISYCFDLTPQPPPPLKPRFNVRYLEGYSY